MRRQIHIQSEQKRRAQIRDGFDELRKHLPGCNNKKMSKAALLTRSKSRCGIFFKKNQSSSFIPILFYSRATASSFKIHAIGIA